MMWVDSESGPVYRDGLANVLSQPEFVTSGQQVAAIFADGGPLDLAIETYGKDYEAYCTRVRRIIPTFKDYKRNQNSFNLRKVVLKENDSVFNMLVMYVLVLLYKERVFTGGIGEPFYYIIPGVVLITGYMIVKIIKKKR